MPEAPSEDLLDKKLQREYELRNQKREIEEELSELCPDPSDESDLDAAFQKIAVTEGSSHIGGQEAYKLLLSLKGVRHRDSLKETHAIMKARRMTEDEISALLKKGV